MWEKKMNLYLWDSCGMSKMKELYKPDWPFNSPHWSPHKSFSFSSGNLAWNQHIFFLSLRHYLRMYRYWKRKFLLAPSWEWKGFVSDRFLLFCETNISNLFLKLRNNFLGSSPLFPVYFIVSWERVWLYVCEDMTYGPEATQSSSRNSDLGPL